MFEEHKTTEVYKPSVVYPMPADISAKRTALMIVLLVIFGSVSLFFGYKWLVNQAPDYNEPAAVVPAKVVPGAPVPTSSLPTEFGEDGGAGEEGVDSEADDIRAENLAFGQFYKEETEQFSPTVQEMKLPIFSKTDLVNYYDVSRKLELEKGLDGLNRSGLAFLDNKYAGAKDFNRIYESLIKDEIPQLVTSDFLVYYYQNQLKEAFKDIENNVFYQDLWQINRSLFDIASARYRKSRDRLGVSNDPLLEAERLEAAYFAVGLELLKPQAKQVGTVNNINNDKLFTSKEANDFDFSVPDYLADDVVREVKLIRDARAEAKSPIFWYQKDYSDYAVPSAYQKTAKLNNFFLASRWMNSVFPLYYKSETCKNCLLDQNDWLVNQIAASLITKDFSANQPLKNRWAKIYKILSYFRGIRKELTYLHYHQVLASLYGESYDPEQLFGSSPASDGRESASQAMGVISKLQDELSSGYNFSTLEGGLDRNDADSRPQVGMRILQELYWPNDFIFNNLVGERAGPWLGKIDASKAEGGLPFTACGNKNGNIKRCLAVSMDIANLLHPFGRENGYFSENANYKNYVIRVDELRSELGKFNQDAWHSNNYWTFLDIEKKSLLGQAGVVGPINTKSASWREHELDTAMAAWVNLQLPADTLGLSSEESGSLGSRREVNAVIEPNLRLVDELLANTKMLTQMFAALKLGRDVDFTSKKLADLTDQLEKVKLIIKKELSSSVLDDNDQSVISDLFRQTAVLERGAKVLDIKLPTRTLRQSIDGMKLMATVYEVGGKKYLYVGPVFDYNESK